MSEIQVFSTRADGGWTCRVYVSDDAGSRSFEVRASDADLTRYDPGATDPTDLVHRSLEFLLAREPKESILGRFELPVIGRYYPEYESEILAGRRA
jgi:hypothetical protein